MNLGLNVPHGVIIENRSEAGSDSELAISKSI
jgi:hypothetical protein